VRHGHRRDRGQICYYRSVFPTPGRRRESQRDNRRICNGIDQQRLRRPGRTAYTRKIIFRRREVRDRRIRHLRGTRPHNERHRLGQEYAAEGLQSIDTRRPGVGAHRPIRRCASDRYHRKVPPRPDRPHNRRIYNMVGLSGTRSLHR